MWTKKSTKKVRKQVRGCLQNLSIGSYSPKVRTFGTLITSTKVFSHNNNLQNSSQDNKILMMVQEAVM